VIGDLTRIVAAIALPAPISAFAKFPAEGSDDTDVARLSAWTTALRADKLGSASAPLGRTVARVGEMAIGTPYVANTLEAYLRAGGSATGVEPLTVSLTRFDCVTLVESCLALSRVARGGATPTWERFGREVERMRYRDGRRESYTSRLHYFSEWIADGQRRGLLRDLGESLGGIDDVRPLRFMTEHRGSYVALADDKVYQSIAKMELSLDGRARKLIPTERIAEVSNGIQTGDVLAFATSIPGLDVTHAALAYRDADGVLRVLHAPLSGGAVEVSKRTLTEYVGAIKRSTGILVARPA
jgi:hypothetical protein